MSCLFHKKDGIYGSAYHSLEVKWRLRFFLVFQTLICNLKNSWSCQTYRLLDVWLSSVNLFVISKDFSGLGVFRSILLTTWDFQDSSSHYRFATSTNWPDMAGPVFVDTRFLLFISLKMPRLCWSTPCYLTFELASLTWEEILCFPVTAGGLW